MTNAELLVPLERLKARVGMAVEEDVWDATLKEALAIGVTEAEDFLRCKLSITENKDVFDIALSNYLNRLGGDGRYTLVTKNRFISNVKVYLVTRANERNDITDTCLVNSDKGIVMVPTAGVTRYIEVEYSSGVTADTIPEWAADLVLTLAGDAFALPNEDKRTGARGVQQNLVSTYEAHHRQVPFAIRPIM